MKALYQKIRSLEGKNYGLYKSLADKPWDFGDFTLEFLHVQGDPYAPASRIMVKAPLQNLGYGPEWGGSFERRLALSDYLLRRLCQNVQERFPEKDGAVAIVAPGPEMLVRNSLWIDNGDLRACLQVRLPADGRKIQAEAAAEILTMTLPDLVSASLYNDEPRGKNGTASAVGTAGANGAASAVGTASAIKTAGGMHEFFRVLDERRETMEQMHERGLVAFVPDGAVLPRESGLSERPMPNAVPFSAPPEMSVTLRVGGRDVRGMGIPKGITVITGGAFHGKSTLLQALTRAVYPHIPGDGREGIVIDDSAVRIGVEDGRSVRDTDISALVRDLPGGVSTKNFCTASASGSTSEASNLLEAMEFGSRTFLIDEDSSAVNFLIRDHRVRELLGNDREPLIPLTDRIREFAHPATSAENANAESANAAPQNACAEKTSTGKTCATPQNASSATLQSAVPQNAEIKNACSFIIVAGACGDFLGLADNIIVMANYNAECAKAGDKFTFENPEGNLAPFAAPKCRNFDQYVKPLLPALRPTSAVERQVKVKLSGDTLLQMGFLSSDTAKAGELIDKQQRLGAGFMLLNLCQGANSNNKAEGEETANDESRSIRNVICTLHEKMMNVGFRNLPQGMSREMSLPRPVDIACVLFRLRDYKR